MNYKELTAPELVKEWKKTVNDNVMMGRDSALLKDALRKYSSAQILLGMHILKDSGTVSIPQFLRQIDELLPDDEIWCEIELATRISNKKPPEYFVYLDNIEGYDSTSFLRTLDAKNKLREWADRILA